MVVTCEQVWQEVSNYLDGDVSAELRAALEVHVKDCNRCRAVLEGTQNVVSVYADDRVLQVPFGYHQRLRNRLQSAMPRPKGTLYSWALVFAAAALIVGSVALVGAASSRNPLRDQLAQQGSKVPPHLQVIVVDGGKTFHVAGCTFMDFSGAERGRATRSM